MENVTKNLIVKILKHFEKSYDISNFTCEKKSGYDIIDLSFRVHLGNKAYDLFLFDKYKLILLGDINKFTTCYVAILNAKEIRIHFNFPDTELLQVMEFTDNANEIIKHLNDKEYILSSNAFSLLELSNV